MSAFKDRIKNYNAQKETKVNPPEAKTVLEEKAAPEVENVKPAPSPEPSGVAPVAAAEPSATASAEAPKAKRGRPAGSKNSAKQPEAEPTMEATSPAPCAVEDDPIAAVRALLALSGPAGSGIAFAVPVAALVEALFNRGYGVTRL